MSKFLEINKRALVPGYLHRKSMSYILEEFQGNLQTFRGYPYGCAYGKEEECAQLLMNAAKNRLRMYGSAREFAKNLKIYGSFSGNDLFFDLDEFPYQTNAIVYRSLKNDEEYICNLDLFVILQNILLKISENPPMLLAAGLKTGLDYYLKNLDEEVNENSLKFVRFDEKIFEGIEKDLREMIAKRRPNGPDHQLFSSEFPEIKSLVDVIEKRQELFHPTVKVVRLFEDGDQKFVMKAEVDYILNKTKDDTEICFLHTMGMEEAERTLGKNTFEFIRCPIQRAKHRAVPIKGCGGGKQESNFYILAVDALFEYLRSVIFGAKFLQKMSNFDEFSRILSDFQNVFTVEFNRPYFIRMSVMNGLSAKLPSEVEKLPADEVRISFFFHTVRNAKCDGFTLQNLKNELKHLGLTKALPEIQDYAEVVYDHVDRVKAEEYLRTCDLFDAIEQCQLICIFNRLPNLKKFLHNQNGCGRVVGLKCDECEKEKKTPEVQISSQNDSQMELIEIKKELEDLKKNYEKAVESESKLKEELEKETLEKEKNRETILTLKAENAANERVIQQLLDKLKPIRSNEDRQNAVEEAPFSNMM
ncbi:hypothetical protein GCK72_011752 [Caenorhabditis remanei]|uniref:DUF7809 domain-containing protein n=1 Tax=Caenorhabditis remanei TaxID=31234 RepID=A0A6A5H9E3_CAERE|nr:hypothetical protein GCK72_011752 [Caenorhabditis remanei]KAF1763486.1 hypothetical protein GCK72_011752 [Caenorhabditis remanei]